MAKAIGECVQCKTKGEFSVAGIRYEGKNAFVKLECDNCGFQTPYLKIRKDTLEELIGEIH